MHSGDKTELKNAAAVQKTRKNFPWLTIEKIGPVYIAEQLKILGHHLLKGGPNPQGLTYYYEKFADRMENISGENKNRLRESTRKILNNLSPIFDEQVDYYKTNILPRLDQ